MGSAQRRLLVAGKAVAPRPGRAHPCIQPATSCAGRLKNRQDLGGTSNVRPVDIHAIDANLSRRNTSVIDQIVHPIEATQKSRLSAPGRADERCYLFLWDLQTNTLQCLGIAITKVNLIDINNRSCNLHRGHRIFGGFRSRRCRNFTRDRLGNCASSIRRASGDPLVLARDRNATMTFLYGR